MTSSAHAGTGHERTNGFEHEYMTMLVEHHATAIELTDAVLERGERDDVREMAGRMRSDQASEIEQLRGWLRDWYGSDTEPRADESMLAGLDGRSGEELDREFLTRMARHHQQAIERGRDAVGRLEHEELRAMTEEMIEKQSRERDEMERMRSQ